VHQQPEVLIVGLGNPGVEYERTPHNLGFLVIDQLAERNGGLRVNRPESKAFTGLGIVGKRAVVLAKPQTFMNLSGPSVGGLLEKYTLSPANLIVVYDEMDLPWSAVRIKKSGSAAGHNGMKSVIGSLGTDNFIRVRMGIDPNPKRTGEDSLGADEKERRSHRGPSLVLGKFRPSQAKDVEELLSYTAEAIESIIADGVEKAMTKFNRRAQGLNTEDA
jgi:PTH1 family peptidyl-tRNA hydrolase